jgi:hypothetical protein
MSESAAYRNLRRSRLETFSRSCRDPIDWLQGIATDGEGYFGRVGDGGAGDEFLLEPEPPEINSQATDVLIDRKQASSREDLSDLCRSWDLLQIAHPLPMPVARAEGPTTARYQGYVDEYHYEHPTEKRKLAEVQRWRINHERHAWRLLPVPVRLTILRKAIGHTLSGFEASKSLRQITKSLPTLCLYRELRHEMKRSWITFDFHVISVESVEQLGKPSCLKAPMFYDKMRARITN